jgi:xanthine dehydrogenase small subunit
MTSPSSLRTQSMPPANAPLRFWHRGEIVSRGNVPPHSTLLNLLREDLRLTATKEGCAAGDCGACTVVLGQLHEGRLRYKAVNSCIKPAQSIDGMALWTAADLTSADGALHPVQRAMVEHHGSQCGFCTSGFVMSLWGLYQRTVACGGSVQPHAAHAALSGNLCRCTGYRPIVDAACSLQADPKHAVKEDEIIQRLKQLPAGDASGTSYQRPHSLQALLQARTRHRDATLIAGATDAGLWITQGLQDISQVIDLTQVEELKRIEHYPSHLAIGAAVTLQDAFDGLAQERPVIAPFAERFAGFPVRQSGTLGGNIANGSPIGDSMPLLIALGAQVVLMAWRKGHAVSRHVPLEDFYSGYRRTLLHSDEVLAWIVVPRPQEGEWLGVYKVSKRQEDDISAVCLALRLQRTGDMIQNVRIGAGGVAATPMRARKTEATLMHKSWTLDALKQAQTRITEEFTPISDLRASGEYRSSLLQMLLHRAWLESHGQTEVRLEDLA